MVRAGLEIQVVILMKLMICVLLNLAKSNEVWYDLECHGDPAYESKLRHYACFCSGCAVCHSGLSASLYGHSYYRYVGMYRALS